MQLAIDVAGFSPRRGRPAAPGDGLQALARRGWRGCATGSTRAWPRNGITGDLADDIYAQARRVRQLRLPGEPRDQLRVPGLRQRLAQALPPGRVLRGAAQRAADGLLLAAVAGRRRPPARGGWCAGPDINASARPGHPGAARDAGGPRTGRGSRRDQWGVGGPVVRLGLSERPHPRRRGGRADRGGTRPRRPVPGHGRPGPADRADRPRTWRRWPPRTPSRASGCAAARRCGRRARRRRTRPDRLPGTATGVDAPALPGMDDVDATGRRRVGDRPVPGQPPGAVRPATAGRAVGAVPIARAATVEPARGSSSAGSSRTGSGRRPRAGSRS